MPSKRRGKNRLVTAMVSCVLLAVGAFWAGCDVTPPESKTGPPIARKLEDIGLKTSEDSRIFTPTGVSSPEPAPLHTPTAERSVPEEKGTIPSAPTDKKEPTETAKKPTGGTIAPPQSGEFVIQIGAYIIDENLVRIKEKIVSLGFSPHVKEMKQSMKMFCVVVREGAAEKDARETMTALSEKGFVARLLPAGSGMFDVAAGIYYYRDDASATEAKVKALGYTPRVEERTVEVALKRLRIGGYGTIEEAKKDLIVLERKGFSPVILKSDQ